MKEHNYMAKIRALWESGACPPGTYSGVDVSHDDWCNLLTGKGTLCNCDPDVKVAFQINGNLN